MSKKLKYLVVVLGLMLLAASWIGFRVYQELGKRGSEDPLVWEADITALESAAQAKPPPENAVVFVGSSSIRLWDSRIQYIAPLLYSEVLVGPNSAMLCITPIV